MTRVTGPCESRHGAPHTYMRLSKHRHRVITNIHLAMSEYTLSETGEGEGEGEGQLIKS